MHNIEANARIAQLCEFIKRSTNKIILISNELGMGLVPETQLGRSFRDLHGKMNQDIAYACEKVTFVAAGLPIALK
jgi:adenosylcobinamide kinase / adenosylcobinamide-phosphate guanylyltransferase